MRWLRQHPVATAAIAIAIAWIVYRVSKGLQIAGPGHSSPEDAISYGWSVYQRGITGWQEKSPDGGTIVDHDSGWTGDPYQKA